MSDNNNYYNYCDQCGNEIEKRADNLFVCPNCTNTNYVNPKPCNVAIIINDKKQILLTKRKFNPFANSWDLPGGFVTINETLEQSLVRELHEELSLKVTEDQLTYFKSYIDRYHYSKKNYYTLGFVFFVKLDKIQISQMKFGDDVSEFRFFKYNEIPISEIKFPSLLTLMSDVKYFLL